MDDGLLGYDVERRHVNVELHPPSRRLGSPITWSTDGVIVVHGPRSRRAASATSFSLWTSSSWAVRVVVQPEHVDVEGARRHRRGLSGSSSSPSTWTLKGVDVIVEPVRVIEEGRARGRRWERTWSGSGEDVNVVGMSALVEERPRPR